MLNLDARPSDDREAIVYENCDAVLQKSEQIILDLKEYKEGAKEDVRLVGWTLKYNNRPSLI